MDWDETGLGAFKSKANIYTHSHSASIIFSQVHLFFYLSKLFFSKQVLKPYKLAFKKAKVSS